MARVFTRKEVDALIEAAVGKATAPLLERIAVLEAELAKAKKNSSNSSKPPSSDLVKPPKPPRKDGKRKRGGQPGHEQHLRPDFPPEAIDDVVIYTLDGCPDCGGKLRLFDNPADVMQQVEGELLNHLPSEAIVNLRPTRSDSLSVCKVWGRWKLAVVAA